MTETEPVIQTRNLTKTYQSFLGRTEVNALDNLSLEVPKGEIFGILGPNGSGKTTTIKILLGLLFPTSGSAHILGKPATNVAIKAKIGFLPEESYLYKFLNADETLDFFGRLFHLDRKTRKQRADQLIEQFGLQTARKRRLKEYSKGMIRRVSFAQALINDPDLIILDEPTSGLDPISSRQMKDLILDLKKKGKTIFLSSHLLADVQNICDRIAILHQGKLRKLGSVKEILQQDASVTMTFENLPEEVRTRIESLAGESGARLVQSEKTRGTLEEIFLQTIEEKAKSE